MLTLDNCRSCWFWVWILGVAKFHKWVRTIRKFSVVNKHARANCDCRATFYIDINLLRYLLGITFLHMGLSCCCYCGCIVTVFYRATSQHVFQKEYVVIVRMTIPKRVIMDNMHGIPYYLVIWSLYFIGECSAALISQAIKILVLNVNPVLAFTLI